MNVLIQVIYGTAHQITYSPFYSRGTAMQETYTVTVRTADGKCWIQEKITCDLQDLYWQLSRLFNQLWYQSGGSPRLEMLPGSGTSEFVGDS